MVVIAIIAVLVAIILPALAGAREAGRSALCLSNHRHIVLISQSYADENRGIGPAIGQPYAAPPNWALVVQQSAGVGGDTSADLYNSRSALVCPTVDAVYSEQMTRTYAMNATGHAGLPAQGGFPADPDNYDSPYPAPMACINFNRVSDPSSTPLVVDSRQPPPGGQPLERCWSMLDFRQIAHIQDRLALFHSGGAFNSGLFDGAARAFHVVSADWTRPLP